MSHALLLHRPGPGGVQANDRRDGHATDPTGVDFKGAFGRLHRAAVALGDLPGAVSPNSEPLVRVLGIGAETLRHWRATEDDLVLAERNLERLLEAAAAHHDEDLDAGASDEQAVAAALRELCPLFPFC